MMPALRILANGPTTQTAFSPAFCADIRRCLGLGPPGPPKRGHQDSISIRSGDAAGLSTSAIPASIDSRVQATIHDEVEQAAIVVCDGVMRVLLDGSHKLGRRRRLTLASPAFTEPETPATATRSLER